MLKEMAKIAAECVKSPRKVSVWVPELHRYVCADASDPDQSRAAVHHVPREARTLDPRFKLVFVTAAIGTLFFTTVCVTITLLAGKNEPPLLERIVMSFADLAKIGFGAIVGMLGGKALDSPDAMATKQEGTAA